MQPPGITGINPDAESNGESADIESLRAAYFAVAGQTGRVVSGKVMKEALHTITGANPAHAASLQTFGLSHTAGTSQRNGAATPIPPKAKTLSQALSPVDAAIQAISEADTIQANPQANPQSAIPLTQNQMPQNTMPKATIEQALQRSQDFSASLQSGDDKPYAAPVEVAARIETISAPKSENTNATKPAVSVTAPVENKVETRHPELRIPHSETTVSQAIPVAEHQSVHTSERSVKLPKFLVAPETADAGSSTMRSKTIGKSSEKATFGVAGNPLPPVAQDLFGDLKLSRPKSVDTLIQEEDLRNAAISEIRQEKKQPVEKQPVKNTSAPYFDTTPSAGAGSNAKPASFSDFLEPDANTPLKLVGNVPLEGEEEWVDRYQRYESAWVKLFERPRLLLGFLGLGIVSCSVYIALGYWWFGGSPISQAAEPVNMLDVREDGDANRTDPTSVFNNIRSVQQGAHGAKAKGSEAAPAKARHEGILLAQAAPAFTGLAGEPAGSSPTEPLKSEPTGRPDPFDPLVRGEGNAVNEQPVEEKKKDVLGDLQYTGFIGDINSRDKVALIRVNDAMSGTVKTQIKKVGESFSVDGENVVLRGISKKAVLLGVDGETRQLEIQPYQALKPVPSNGANGPQSGGPAAVNSSGAAGGPAMSPGSGASTEKLNGGAPSKLSLKEPLY